LSQSKLAITVGFILVLVLLLAVIALSAQRLSAIDARHRQILHENDAKVEVLRTMRNIVRERSLSMFRMNVQEDIFAKDEEYQQFRALASEFIKSRTRLEAMNLSEDEQTLLGRAKDIIRQTQPLQDQIVDRIYSDRSRGISKLMDRDLPLEVALLNVFDHLIDAADRAEQQAISAAEAEYKDAYRSIVVMGFVASLIVLFILGVVLWRTRSFERSLFEEKELAEVTLHAIGDGVITTDQNGLVTDINPVAERLSGWRRATAIGQPVAKVYYTISEKDRTPIYHPVYELELAAQVMGMQRYSILLSHQGDEYIVEDIVSPIHDRAGGIVGKVLVFRDVTHSRGIEQQLNWQATHDSLTGLNNRLGFELGLNDLLDDAKHHGKQHALLYIDLDQFKIVNDSVGHVAGDQLLAQLAAILEGHVRRRSDTLSRLGGDEFAVLLRDCDLPRAQQIAEELRKQIEDYSFEWQGRSFKVGASIGLVAIDRESGGMVEVLSAADTACYVAKERGRNRVWISSPNDEAISKQRREFRWVARLQEALKNDEFVVCLQRVDTAVPNSPYAELLIRLPDADGTLIPPMAFIPAAERYDLMPNIDRWMLDYLLDRLPILSDRKFHQCVFAVNVSGCSLSDENFIDYAYEKVKASPRFASQICFEITETAVMQNLRLTESFMRRMRSLGCRFALDDYGSGTTNFPYLKRLKVDYVKIDGSLIKDLLKDDIDQVMVSTIIQIAKRLDIKTIAEFVDSAEVATRLRDLGVDYYQGYLYHRPEPVPQLAQKVTPLARS
jgi:diguanylate cyclase (GGDEF)-like protein/PAS domain S-box-containing protein